MLSRRQFCVASKWKINLEFCFFFFNRISGICFLSLLCRGDRNSCLTLDSLWFDLIKTFSHMYLSLFHFMFYFRTYENTFSLWSLESKEQIKKLSWAYKERKRISWITCTISLTQSARSVGWLFWTKNFNRISDSFDISRFWIDSLKIYFSNRPTKNDSLRTLKLWPP